MSLQDTKVLYDTPYVKLKQTDTGFYFLERKGVNSIGIFLVRFKAPEYSEIEVLLHFQPLMINEHNNPCPITGSIEEGEFPHESAIREAYEEGGYKITTQDMQFLTLYAVGTQTNEQCFLYTADVTLLIQEEVKGDGTYWENLSVNRWKSLNYLKTCTYGATQLGYYLLKECYQ